MIFLTQNKTLFCTRFTDAAATLEKNRPAEGFETIETPSGSVSAVFRGITLHSRHNPVREAENLINSQITREVPLCLFYGFGLGYLVEAFIKAFPDTPCAVIEPDVSLFLCVLETRDLSHLFNHGKLVFFLDTIPEKIIPYIERTTNGDLQIVKLRSVWEKDRNYYEYADAIFTTFLKRRDINQNTLARFGKLWVKNLFQNISVFVDSPGIEQFKSRFRDIPALVVAGGPSLEAVLPLLPLLAERMTVIAVDTTLKAIQASGVTPDFVIISDPQYWNTRHLDRALSGKTIIISEAATHPRVFRLFANRILFFSSFFPFGKYMESLIGEKGKLGAGGSVATTAWDFARQIGSSKIYMAGLDLGFPEKRTHFRGSYFEQAFHCSENRLSPNEQLSFHYLHSGGLTTVPANNGALVNTDQRMIVYKFWFETQMKLYSDAVTISLSPSGVKIEGIPFGKANELVSLPKSRNKIDTIREDVFRELSSAYNPDRAGFSGQMRILKQNITTLREIARQGVSAVKDLKKRLSNRISTEPAFKRLESIDQAISQFPSREIAAFLIQPLIYRICDEPARSADEDPLETSLSLYTEIEKSARFHEDLMKSFI